MLIYAGIGSRDTPTQICSQMTSIACQLGQAGWLLRSGHAHGADQAFEAGAKAKEVHLPWEGYNYGRTSNPSFLVPYLSKEIVAIAEKHHPHFNGLSTQAKLFMCRNVTIVLGTDLLTPVNMVVCYQPSHKTKGGTLHGMRVAETYKIPVFSLALHQNALKLCEQVEAIEEAHATSSKCA